MKLNSKLAGSLAEEIRACISVLVSEGLVDDQEFPSVVKNRGTHKRPADWEVGRAGFSARSVLANESYIELYQNAVASRNYSMIMIDGAMLQFWYRGSGEDLVSHRLAYLPAPDLLPYVTDPELYLRDVAFLEVVGEQVFPVPIRFDFDSREGVAQDVDHPTSHMTLGQYKNCRIPVTKSVSPSNFVEFVVGNLYSAPGVKRLEFLKKVAVRDDSITDGERGILHVVQP